MAADTYYPQAVLAWLDTSKPQQLSLRSVRLWSAINEELAPIVGDNGFTALFTRCLHVCSATYPWLTPAPDCHSAARSFETLAAQMATRSPAEALSANSALFGIFYDLLLNLIGEALTASVLDAAWCERLLHRPQRGVLKSVPIKPR